MQAWADVAHRRTQHHWVPRLGMHNFKSLCGAGARGMQPCVTYLSEGPPPSSVIEILRSVQEEMLLKLILPSGVDVKSLSLCLECLSANSNHLGAATPQLWIWIRLRPRPSVICAVHLPQMMPLATASKL